MEEIATIISFFAGAIVAKNWPRIKKYLPFNKVELIFGAEREERVKRVKNEEKNKTTLAPRKKIKRKRLARRKQLIKERQSKQEGRPLKRKKVSVPKIPPAVTKLSTRAKSFFAQPAAQSVAKLISKPTPVPNYKIIELPKQEQFSKPEELPKPAPQEELKSAPEPVKEPLKPENTEGAEKEQAPKAAPDEFKPRSNFWSQLIKKI